MFEIPNIYHLLIHKLDYNSNKLQNCILNSLIYIRNYNYNIHHQECYFHHRIIHPIEFYHPHILQFRFPQQNMKINYNQLKFNLMVIFHNFDYIFHQNNDILSRMPNINQISNFNNSQDMKTDTHDTHHKGCHCHHRMTHFL